MEFTMERTLSIIKPDATGKNLVGKILARFEEEGLRICALRKIHMSKRVAGGFYSVHRERPFFGELTDFMSSGPCVVLVLEGENAITRNREIMGATNPAEAAEGTLRKLYADSIGENAVHGSDSPENAAIEIAYFFRSTELH
jgi:nucleoside-diphosphate kinase